MNQSRNSSDTHPNTECPFKCFVTVGSTQFERLVSSFFQNDLLQSLSHIGINKVTIQAGSGAIPKALELSSHTEGQWETEINGIKIILYQYKNSIRADMEEANLIVGHAGAGTCLEALGLGKPFIAVINNALMDDHQKELAEQLAKDGHLLCALPENLATTLRSPSLFNLVPFPRNDSAPFSQLIRDLLFELKK